MRRNAVSLGILVFTVLLICAPFSGAREGVSDDAPAAARGLSVKKELPASSKRYALIIGVDTYDDAQISRLEGAANDANTLASALIQHAGFPSEQVILLASDQPRERKPTRGNILKRLANLRGAVPPDGLLLVSFAGHGLQHEGKAFLLPADAQTGDLTLLDDTTISVDVMQERVQQTGVKQVVMILDACRNDAEGRGDSVNRLTDAYVKAFDFYNRNSGIEAFATLYATEVGARAYEYTERKHGYFTWALVEGLKGRAANERGEVTLARLVNYLQEQVPRRVHLDLGRERKQRPWADIQGYKADELVLSLAAKSQVNNETNAADMLRPEAAPGPDASGTGEINNVPNNSREPARQISHNKPAGPVKTKAQPNTPAPKPPALMSQPRGPARPPSGHPTGR